MEQINKKLMNWASILDPRTREQAIVSAGMPFIFPHLALMPDAHVGKGATVGSVIPTVGAIIPAAVGVDIGCGMIAMRTQLSRADLPADRAPLHASITAAVPLSAGKYNRAIDEPAAREIAALKAIDGVAQAEAISPNWRHQVGSLGSGNHFIEVSLDEDDRVWLFLHSGSRGVGNKLAMKHIKVAQEQCAQRWITLPSPDLAYLVEGDEQFWTYLEALRWAQRFAFLNRVVMMERITNCFAAWTDSTVEPELTINCHHNHTAQETHFGQRVWLSRKGAIDANVGAQGLIPGSMGAASYVVTGKGNRLALNSAPHGAGRNHSRTAARRLFDRSDLDQRMEGIEWGHSDAFLDDHPDAYKDIDTVMADAADLVTIDHTLRQIVNVKGD